MRDWGADTYACNTRLIFGKKEKMDLRVWVCNKNELIGYKT